MGMIPSALVAAGQHVVYIQTREDECKKECPWKKGYNYVNLVIG